MFDHLLINRYINKINHAFNYVTNNGLHGDAGQWITR